MKAAVMRRRADDAPFGERLRAVRQARMLTQAELAECVGAHQSQVSLWEAGRHTPRAARRRQIAAALGLRPLDV